jgi:hypothetical protein
MANLDDLNNPSITSMTIDESLERIRQIRLARRTPPKSTTTRTTKTSSTKKVDISTLTDKDKEELLASLLGD